MTVEWFLLLLLFISLRLRLFVSQLVGRSVSLSLSESLFYTVITGDCLISLSLWSKVLSCLLVLHDVPTTLNLLSDIPAAAY